jgi:hypothetical protein
MSMPSAAPAPASAATEKASAAGLAPRPRHRLRAVLMVDAVILVAAVVALAIVDPFASTTPGKGVADNAGPTSVGTVTRQRLSDQTQESATLGYAGSYSVINHAQGTITSLPAVGHVATQGHVLYEVNGQPVVLLYGSTPAYRSLSEGALASDVTGPDVQELNADLVALGYVTRAELSPASDEFTWATKVGVEDLQNSLGVSQNGTLALGQAVFLPTAARVTAISATLGATAGPGQPVMSATSTARQVSIPLDADQQSEVAVGDHVTITLPDNQNTPGVISSVGTVATAPAAGSSDSSPTITVLVNPTDPAATGTWDQAPVEVSITAGSVSNALVVPVDALLAQSSGGYAVEVVGADDGIHRLVPVSLGLFDDADGLVQVTGSGLAAGQQVVTPTR